MTVDEALLDDADRISAADPGAMLREVASAGAQVRQALVTCADARLDSLVGGGRPRAVVVAGMGGSGIAGHVLQAAAGPGCPVPVERVRGWTLPAWVGAMDVVLAVSSSGRTAETLGCAREALRRGSRVVVVAAEGSPLVDLAEQAGAPWVPVPDGRAPRANLWALSVPLLVAADLLGIVDAPADELGRVADLLDDLAERCGPARETADNPAKLLAADLVGTLPLVWGTSDLAGIAAYRFLCQLAENAKYPAVNGVLPEALHNQVVTFAGPFAGAGSGDDLFRDRVADDGRLRLRLVMLGDTVEHELVARGAAAAVALAGEYGVPVSRISAVGEHPLERMASLCAIGDFASVYLGLVHGVDPTPIVPIQELKARIGAGGYG
ncbi:MAG: mannose-6-phosphate isomerase [Actinomycetota bacterium]|nr:mannose-6-phosphate isomerase [Actinomycetota bacterium]MDH4352513.1 mannose-6-phosphate isomerase [Actinomycetota bacterium]